MEPTRSILLVEEDAVTRAFLADNLTADGFAVLVADGKPRALTLLERSVDLVVCDVNGDTLALVDAVREADGLASSIDPDVPLIVMTARRDELARVRYLEHGGDDVVGKPLRYPELLARIRAVLRRSTSRTPRGALRIGTLQIDVAARDVRLAGVPIELPGKQFALLVHLAGEPTRVFTKAELLRDMWGYRNHGTTRTLDSHAVRLRQTLRAVDGGPWITNIWGVGDQLVPAQPDAPTAPDEPGDAA